MSELHLTNPRLLVLKEFSQNYWEILEISPAGTRCWAFILEERETKIIIQTRTQFQVPCKTLLQVKTLSCNIRLPGSMKVGLKKVAKSCQLDFMVQCKERGLVGGLAASSCFLSILSIFLSNESHFHSAEKNSAKISQMSFHLCSHMFWICQICTNNQHSWEP